MSIKLSLALYAHALFYHAAFVLHHTYDSNLAWINTKWDNLH